ncbi:uncharacterized protein EDB91DRAFT_1299983 [Suillus paluster]|uniref:uncharacterized protein n=1 Tax=Suillus paluster TaxID=48578 RepID=UPI001B862EBC|nr:uncharacterized protein EDB91DRAFT_1299983 [Suillus paluster]KAG1733638.1 hypothetical protein EDB91DRAFT_1299983 [Suillus paluster]
MHSLLRIWKQVSSHLPVGRRAEEFTNNLNDEELEYWKDAMLAGVKEGEWAPSLHNVYSISNHGRTPFDDSEQVKFEQTDQCPQLRLPQFRMSWLPFADIKHADGETVTVADSHFIIRHWSRTSFSQIRRTQSPARCLFKRHDKNSAVTAEETRGHVLARTSKFLGGRRFGTLGWGVLMKKYNLCKKRLSRLSQQGCQVTCGSEQLTRIDHLWFPRQYARKEWGSYMVLRSSTLLAFTKRMTNLLFPPSTSHGRSRSSEAAG